MYMLLCLCHLTLTTLVRHGLPDSAATLIIVSLSSVKPETLLFCDLINGTKAEFQHLLVNWHLNGNCQWNISIWLLSYESSAGSDAVGSEGDFFLVLISQSHTWPDYTQRYNMTLMPFALLTKSSNHASEVSAPKRGKYRDHPSLWSLLS